MHHRRPRRTRIKRHLAPTPSTAVHCDTDAHATRRTDSSHQPHAPPPTPANQDRASPRRPRVDRRALRHRRARHPGQRIRPINCMRDHRPRRTRIERDLAPIPVNRRALRRRRTSDGDERLPAVDRHRSHRARIRRVERDRRARADSRALGDRGARHGGEGHGSGHMRAGGRPTESGLNLNSRPSPSTVVHSVDDAHATAARPLARVIDCRWASAR